MTEEEFDDLQRRQAAIADLKGRNPASAHFDGWNEQWLSDAITYGELTPGCKATIERRLATAAQWDTPAAKGLPWQRVGVIAAIVMAIVTTLAAVLKLVSG